MSAAASRRAGARIFASLSTPSYRSAGRTSSLKAARVKLIRPITTTTRQRQEPQPSATARPTPPPQSTPSQQASANAQKTSNDVTRSEESTPLRSLTEGFDDTPASVGEDETQVDWTRSYHGLSSAPFRPEQGEILQQALNYEDIEIKPDGIIYLPEIKYRRILNKTFGPGGWGLVPRGETIVTGKIVTREYGLVVGGRLVSIARGEQQYFEPDGIPTATEGCKSNALMRCCKDLGIASELWDPRFIKKWKDEMCRETIVEHVTTKKRRKHFMRKDDEIKYPFKEVSNALGGGAGKAAGPGAAAGQASR